MVSRRHFIATASASIIAAPAIAATPVSDDGLHIQPWFSDTFLEFGDDLAEAADAGKHLLVLVEQRGCPYCQELHDVNFAREDIANYIQDNFVAVQLNMWGSRETIDFDGEELGERELCQKWGVQFTPTTMIFDKGNVGATTLREAEAFRLPGYLRPFHYISSLEYVSEGAYRDQPFQRFLQAKVDRLEEQGIHVDLWN